MATAAPITRNPQGNAARDYPNSDTIQPRYAAWLGSLGLPISEEGVSAVRQRFGALRNIEFGTWIRGCMASAPRGQGIIVNGGVADHEAFTEHCWKTAFGDILGRAA